MKLDVICRNCSPSISTLFTLCIFSLFFFVISSVSASPAASCGIKFVFQNYTIITSQCKGPAYPPKLCCKALKEFACPFVKDLNNLSNDCASTMFSYINLFGKYPPGMFPRACKENNLVIACPDSRQ